METGAKDQNVQALRGLAAMLVVTLHAYNFVDEHHGHAWISDALLLGHHYGALGVDLFFVISGAMMALAIERDPRPAAFLLARYGRVVPLFWIAALVSIGVTLLTEGRPPLIALLNSLTIIPVFDRGMYHSPIPSVGWTLAYELYFYAIVALALNLPRAMRADAIAATLFLGAILGAWLQPICAPFIGILCNPILIEFLIGFWSVRTARAPLVRRYGIGMAIFGALVLMAGVLTDFGFPTAPQAVIAGPTSVLRVVQWGAPCGLILIGVMGRSVSHRPSGLLSRLGDASYSIYLVHMAVIAAVGAIWPWWGTVGCDALLTLFVIGSTLAGFAAHRWIETPLLRRLKPQAASETASASTVRPFSLTSANPPSTWMRAETVLGPE